MSAFFSVKNFERFQHYKDRNPPWIKLYNELLDDYEFGRLQDASKAHLLAIWLLASRSDNKIPFDPDWVARRINANSPVDLQCLVDAGFILINQPLQNTEQDASAALAKCLPRERDRGETETEEDAAVAASPAIVLASTESPEAGAKPYAFEEGVIRLKKPDLDKWKAAYKNLDLEAELLGLAEWAGRPENSGHWFHAVSGALTKRNRQAKERVEATARGAPKQDWRSAIL